MRISCLFGIHDWWRYGRTLEKRRCDRCDKRQYQKAVSIRRDYSTKYKWTTYQKPDPIELPDWDMIKAVIIMLFQWFMIAAVTILIVYAVCLFISEIFLNL